MDPIDPQQAEAAFQQAREVWQQAIAAHVMAPPDGGFSARIAKLARTAARRAQSCEEAYHAGFEWPASPASGEAPYELRRGTARRGPSELWERFDEAVIELGRVSESRSMRAVGRAYADLAEIATELADAVEQQDRASGLIAARHAPDAN